MKTDDRVQLKGLNDVTLDGLTGTIGGISVRLMDFSLYIVILDKPLTAHGELVRAITVPNGNLTKI